MISKNQQVFCRVIAKFASYEVGAIITPSREHRKWLLADKLVEALNKRDTQAHVEKLAAQDDEENDDATPIEAAVAAETETATLSKPKRPGRPRKEAVSQ